MAILDNGIFGTVRKSMNGVTFSTWKGINTARRKVTKIANPRTSGQVENRNAFKACSQFAALILAQMIIPLMNRFAKKMSGYNMFTSLNKSYFDETGIIDQASINFGTGRLGNTAITSGVADVSAGSWTFNWSPDLDNPYKLESDRPYFLVVDSTDSSVVWQGNIGAQRFEGTSTNFAPIQPVLGREYWFYMAFLRNDNTIVGNTSFLAVTAVA